MRSKIYAIPRPYVYFYLAYPLVYEPVISQIPERDSPDAVVNSCLCAAISQAIHPCFKRPMPLLILIDFYGIWHIASQTLRFCHDGG